MTDSAENLATERLRLALEMFELGESMMLERLRRQFPGANEAELQDLVERLFVQIDSGSSVTTKTASLG